MRKLFSKEFLFLALINFLLVKADEYEDEIDDNGKCTLTKEVRKDPFPSLLKCYKYNNDACCLSVHDDYIDSYINKILSTPCIRKYPLFEILMCFGCHPNEYKYIYKKNSTNSNNSTNSTNSAGILTIRICKGFAEELWDGDLNAPSKVFDNCGFKVSEDVLGKNLSAQYQSQNYIIPSQVFKNFSHFMSYIKIPFYETYNIEIQEDTNENCYNNNLYIDNNQIFYLVYILLFALFINI